MANDEADPTTGVTGNAHEISFWLRPLGAEKLGTLEVWLMIGNGEIRIVQSLLATSTRDLPVYLDIPDWKLEVHDCCCTRLDLDLLFRDMRLVIDRPIV